MTGFEIAGVVLGALPILFSAVDWSKRGIGKGAIFFRKRRSVEKLALALLSQRQHLTEIIRSILAGSGCEDLSRLEDDPVEYLMDEAIQEQVLDYLGEETFAALQGQLDHCHETIKLLAIKVAGLVPSIQGPSDDLMRIIRENRDAKSKQLDFLPRVKLMLAAEGFKEITTDLDDTTNSLFRLTRLVLSNRKGTGLRISRGARSIAKTLHRAHESASNLYVAISNAWKGDCHKGHKAGLFLEDRISIGTPASLSFPLAFEAMISEQKTVWHEAVVRVLHDDEHDNDPTQPITICQPHTPSQRVTVIITNAEPRLARPQIDPVENICTAINPICHKDFVLTRQCKIGLIAPGNPTLATSDAPAMTPLKDLLHSRSSAAQRAPVSLRSRMLLALNLASNLLQLFRTNWLPNACWSYEHIFFPAGTEVAPQPRAGKPKIDLDRPFVSTSFAKDATHLQGRQLAEPKVALLGLGILLLEIWHEETLEAHFSLEKRPTEFYERLVLALNWLDEMTNPPPELYDRAASHCIKGMVGGEVRLGQWDDGEVWNAICGDIIEPLLKNCKMWR
ncbi:hypothetical protein B0H66DRAFT_483219 [Apodospora peruviana]|uniref:DUF7580 domain-containing protein n=1 Tax=Apodospora peruviana TaxID=516989 RepID=A0AAE0HWR4_9PEZI|nr:hypothetical protein B0H66DRAFT_483219 [Apodospora peruviana]